MAVKRWWPLTLLIIILAGCGRPTFATPPAEFVPQTAQKKLPTVTRAPIATPLPRDTGWQTIEAGVEYRELKIKQDDRSDRLYLVRLDPAQVRLRVLYEPDQPRRVSDWLASAKALVAVNGNFFDPENRALGLVIQDGQARDGVVYQGFGGMFAVSGDEVRVRSNVQEPYNGESLTYALQNFPMLVLPGGQPNLEIDDNGRLSPRTAVAVDRLGRIVLIVSPGLTFTLTQFGQWLAASDLDLDAALNMDGGTSSGLVLRRGSQNLGTDSWVNVPSVIVVEKRE